jgi:hypothetical protein
LQELRESGVHGKVCPKCLKGFSRHIHGGGAKPNPLKLVQQNLMNILRKNIYEELEILNYQEEPLDEG